MADEAINLKNKGNEALKGKNFDEAIDFYTRAIELDDSNPVFFTNRAQVHLRLESYGAAIADCNSALKLDPNSAKAYYRKGVSQMALLQYKEAQTSFRQALKIVPTDKPTTENLKACTAILKRQAFEKAIASDTDVHTLDVIDFENMIIGKWWEGPELKFDITKDSQGRKHVEIEGLDHEYLKYAIKTFKDGKRLPNSHVIAIIKKVTQILKKENTLVELRMKSDHDNCKDLTKDEIELESSKLTIVGDTHGQFYDLLNLFDKFGFVSKDHTFLFNGDFVDRGSWSCEVALYLYILKILYPSNVFINRGNHETIDMNKGYGFADECEHKYSKKIFDCFTESFGALPYATLINKAYLVMHGGLFSDDKVTLEDIRKVNRFPSSGSTQPPREGIAMELLWTDPQPINGRSPSKRGIGMQFGPDITERFCLTNKIEKVIRSHEVRMGGVEREHNGRLLTVFSAPNYCDSTGNLGGVLHVIANDKYDASKDDGESYRTIDGNSKWKIESETFSAVPHPDLKPMAYSKAGFGF